ncbi:MAG: hypothetical protein ABIL25_04910 [candidate division WOR-3 bacterium]
MRRWIAAAVLLVVIVPFVGGCTKPTKLVGRLILQTGQSGDVQNCRVQLFEKSDLTGTPVKEVASKQNTTVNSPFEFTDVIEGYYYILAWKDLNLDGVLSDKDIVGVHGGTYRPGYGGTQVTVTKGKTTDVGEIVMLIYKELKVNTSGSRTQGGAVTNFTYQFNYDLTLTRFSVVFPDEPGVEYEDNRQPGAKTAGVVYNSDGWNMGGLPMPTGNHILRFQGTWDGTAFDIRDTVVVN